MAVVRVPKTPKSSFNPRRRPSALLLDQVRHLEWAALPAAQRRPGGDLPKRQVATEGAAAERVAQLTAIVRAQQEVPPTPGVVVQVTLPPLPRTKKAQPKPRSRKAASARAGSKAKSSNAADKGAARKRPTQRGRRGRSSR